MKLDLTAILRSAAIDPAEVLVIRHAYANTPPGSGIAVITAVSTHQEILEYTSTQSSKPGAFNAVPPKYWAVFMPEQGSRARLWAMVENHGEIADDGVHRSFALQVLPVMADLRERLVIGWKSPRAWRVSGVTAGAYPVLEIADTAPIVFPGFDKLRLDFSTLQAVMREHRYSSWRTALASVKGVYLITDMHDGRQYVGKADGAESIRQRWNSYAQNGNGGNVELKSRDPDLFLFSLLRVFDPSTPNDEINAAENHFKETLGTRVHGLNRN